MMLRRFSRRIKQENWLAASIDLLIVVVGILIALQVNNWNERRASLIVSDAAKLTLRAELEQAKAEIKRGLAFNRLRLDKGAQLVKGDLGEEDIINDPTLVFFATGYAAFDLRLPVAERELTSEAKILKASKLKEGLRNLFANYAHWQEIGSGMDLYWRNNVLPFFAEQRIMVSYSTLASGGSIDPQIAVNLAANQTYLTHTTVLNHYLGYLVRFQENVLSDIDKSLELLPTDDSKNLQGQSD